MVTRELIVKIRSTKEHESKKIETELYEIKSQIQSIKNDWRYVVKNYIRASKIVNLEKQRYKNGKSSLNDLLEAEFVLQDVESKKMTLPYIFLTLVVKYLETSGGVSSKILQSKINIEKEI